MKLYKTINYQKNYTNELLENLNKVYSSFKDIIWDADHADKKLISKWNEGFRFLLYIIDTYRKNAWVVPLKDKKVLQLLILFEKF